MLIFIFLIFFIVVFVDQAAKRHLIQRIEILDGRMDKQVEISKLNLEQVHL